MASVAKWSKAPVCGTGDHGFESRRSPQHVIHPSRACSSTDRVLGFGPRGCGFESRRARQILGTKKAPTAMVEAFLVIFLLPGLFMLSSPPASSIRWPDRTRGSPPNGRGPNPTSLGWQVTSTMPSGSPCVIKPSPSMASFPTRGRCPGIRRVRRRPWPGRTRYCGY